MIVHDDGFIPQRAREISVGCSHSHCTKYMYPHIIPARARTYSQLPEPKNRRKIIMRGIRGRNPRQRIHKMKEIGKRHLPCEKCFFVTADIISSIL